MGHGIRDLAEVADLLLDRQSGELVERLAVDQFHQDDHFVPGPSLGADLLDAVDPPDRRMRQLLRDLHLVLGLDEEAIVLVALLVENDLLERIDLARLRIEDAEDLARSAGTDVLEHSVTVDEVGKLHWKCGDREDETR